MKTFNLVDYNTDWTDEVGGNLSEHLKKNLYRFNGYIEELNNVVNYAESLSNNDYRYESKTDLINSLIYKEEES